MHGRSRNLVWGLRAISFRTAYEKYSEGPYPLHLIPVLVTGIQQRRVCGAEESFRPLTWSGWIPVTSTGMRGAAGKHDQ